MHESGVQHETKILGRYSIYLRRSTSIMSIQFKETHMEWKKSGNDICSLNCKIPGSVRGGVDVIQYISAS